MKTIMEKLTEVKLKEMGVFSRPIWEKEVSRFDRYYDEREVCYFLEGKVVIEEEVGEKVEVGKGAW